MANSMSRSGFSSLDEFLVYALLLYTYACRVSKQVTVVGLHLLQSLCLSSGRRTTKLRNSRSKSQIPGLTLYQTILASLICSARKQNFDFSYINSSVKLLK